MSWVFSKFITVIEQSQVIHGADSSEGPTKEHGKYVMRMTGGN